MNTLSSSHVYMNRLSFSLLASKMHKGYMGVDETGGDGSGLFAAANEALTDVASTYRDLETAKPPSKEELARLVPFC